MKEEKFEKILKILEVIGITVAAILLVIFKFFPEFKATLGSSDSYVDIDNYDTIVEVKVLSGPNFFLITTNNKLTNILFINDSSCILYNKNIENDDISSAINKLTTILTSESIITDSTVIQLTEYPKNKNYQKIKESILTNIPLVQFQEKNSSLITRAEELELSSSTEQLSLQELQLYSMDLTGSCSTTNNNSSVSPISKDDAKQYADQIYTKLQNYSLTYPNQSIESAAFPLQLIPVTTSDNITIYPGSSSWYYIENGMVYAYISFLDNNDYSFCYQGSQENVKEGAC